jgi:hypothetical protein
MLLLASLTSYSTRHDSNFNSLAVIQLFPTAEAECLVARNLRESLSALCVKKYYCLNKATVF